MVLLKINKSKCLVYASTILLLCVLTSDAETIEGRT